MDEPPHCCAHVCVWTTARFGPYCLFRKSHVTPRKTFLLRCTCANAVDYRYTPRDLARPRDHVAYSGHVTTVIIYSVIDSRTRAGPPGQVPGWEGVDSPRVLGAGVRRRLIGARVDPRPFFATVVHTLRTRTRPETPTTAMRNSEVQGPLPASSRKGVAAYIRLVTKAGDTAGVLVLRRSAVRREGRVPGLHYGVVQTRGRPLGASNGPDPRHHIRGDRHRLKRITANPYAARAAPHS